MIDKKILKVIVAQSRVFDIYLANHSTLTFFLVRSQGRAVNADMIRQNCVLRFCRSCGHHPPCCPAPGSVPEPAFQMIRALSHRACIDLPGSLKDHHKKSSTSCVSEVKCHLEPRVLFYAQKAYGYNRNIAVAGFFKGFAQQGYIIGGAASTPLSGNYMRATLWGSYLPFQWHQ